MIGMRLKAASMSALNVCTARSGNCQEQRCRQSSHCMYWLTFFGSEALNERLPERRVSIVSHSGCSAGVVAPFMPDLDMSSTALILGSPFDFVPDKCRESITEDMKDQTQRGDLVRL